MFPHVLTQGRDSMSRAMEGWGAAPILTAPPMAGGGRISLPEGMKFNEDAIAWAQVVTGLGASFNPKSRLSWERYGFKAASSPSRTFSRLDTGSFSTTAQKEGNAQNLPTATPREQVEPRGIPRPSLDVSPNALRLAPRRLSSKNPSSSLFARKYMNA
eukprot:GEMP01019806.1.p1 GENE.GEMP01019806.1~~GEMP01019806.1.p1  ORF type:complete len:158 (+),score=42.90 GEMP01019806.1:101-574(+)